MMIIWTDENLTFMGQYDQIVVPENSTLLILSVVGVSLVPMQDSGVDEDGGLAEEYTIEIRDWVAALADTVDIIYYAALNRLVDGKPSTERDTWDIKRNLAERVLQGDKEAASIVDLWASPLGMTAKEFAQNVILAKAAEYQAFVVKAEELRQKGKALISAGIPAGKEMEYLQLLNSYLHTFFDDVGA